MLPLPGPPRSSRSKEHRLNHLALDQISQELPIGMSQCHLSDREGPLTPVWYTHLPACWAARKGKQKKKILSPKYKFISDFIGHCIFPPQTLKNRMEALLSQAKQRGHRMHTLSRTSITLVYLLPLRLDLTKEIPPFFSTDRAWDDLSSLWSIFMMLIQIHF